MSKKQKLVFWPALLVFLAASGVWGLLSASTGAGGVDLMKPAPEVASSGTLEPATPPNPHAAPRNLSMQPEAFKLSRKLGRRFNSLSRAGSVLTGTLTTGAQHQPVRIQRRQNNRGEKVEISIGGRPASLSWSDDEGPRSSGDTADEGERLLIERLALDSVDNFVLAQLRGASYYTVGRNVRPEEAGDNYTGPVWDVVRVDDPESDAQRRPLSRWRLYYLNSQTGLIDKVISEINGDRFETNFQEWSDHRGERLPTRITWFRQGQMIMELRLNGFAHN